MGSLHDTLERVPSRSNLLGVRKVLLCSARINQVSLTVVGRKPCHLLPERLALYIGSRILCRLTLHKLRFLDYSRMCT